MTVTAIGAAFIFLAILGGGFEAKELKIPVLNLWARFTSAIVGTVLVVLGTLPSDYFLKPGPAPLPPSVKNVDKGSARQPGSPLEAAAADKSQTALPPASEQFGVALMASSDLYVAQQTMLKAKSVAPEESKIQIYKRKNSLWATVVIYSDNSVALADLSKYTANPDWRDAYVVYLENWCPKAAQLDLVYQSPIGRLSTLDCHL
jgi:hypothetical protein